MTTIIDSPMRRANTSTVAYTNKRDKAELRGGFHYRYVSVALLARWLQSEEVQDLLYIFRLHPLISNVSFHTSFRQCCTTCLPLPFRLSHLPVLVIFMIRYTLAMPVPISRQCFFSSYPASSAFLFIWLNTHGVLGLLRYITTGRATAVL